MDFIERVTFQVSTKLCRKRTRTEIRTELAAA